MHYTCKKCGSPLPADMTKECPVCTGSHVLIPGNRVFRCLNGDGKHIMNLSLHPVRGKHGDVFEVVWTSTTEVSWSLESIAGANQQFYVRVGNTINLKDYIISGIGPVDRETWLKHQKNVEEIT